MRKILFIAFVSLLYTGDLCAQEKSSIGVANPTVRGLDTKPEIAAKMIQLELSRLDQFIVYDEFDLNEVYNRLEGVKNNCHSRTCLIDLGRELGADLMITGSYDLLGDKIVISLKFIDVNAEKVKYSAIGEFNYLENELQRMTQIVLEDILKIQHDSELIKRLRYNNDPITSNKVGQINNSGPRVGVAVMIGNVADFAQRPTSQGGLDVAPVVSMIGYQFEVQYVGTENFSALFEFIGNVSGLEQGLFIPSINILNGFRFGKNGWEFAFGPGFGISKFSQGFIDTGGRYGKKNQYFSTSDWDAYTLETYNDPSAYPEYFNEYGSFIFPSIDVVDDVYRNTRIADTRGTASITTSFLMGFGRTFRAGSLNIPVNIFYSAKKGGGYAGLNIGFNVTKSKKSAKTLK